MLFFFAAPSVKMQYRTDRSLSGIALIKNSISAIYAQSKAEGILNRLPSREQATFLNAHP